MDTSSEPGSGGAGAWAGLIIGTAGAAACLTLLFRAMRSVMAVGGSCASGGPYAVSTPCPKGVGWLFPVAIWVGIGCVAAVAACSYRLGVPSIAWLAWPALFLSLGWNFFEFGLDPAGPETGPVWGWLVCGAMFWVMGGAPLVLALVNPQDLPRSTRTRAAAARASALGTQLRAATTPPPFRATGPYAPPAIGGSITEDRDDSGAEGGDDLVGTLERLDALHRSGTLSDEEYRAAKAQLLGGS